MVTVPDEGGLDAQLLLVGDAPGKADMVDQRPFVGAPGYWLRDVWDAIGWKRRDTYLTHLVPARPRVPYGDVEVACKRGLLTQGDLLDYRDDLLDLVNELPQLKVIVPTGNFSTWALLDNKGWTPWMRRNPTIHKVRGSIYGLQTAHGLVKVVPALHPSEVLAQQQWAERTVADWRRAVGELTIDGLQQPDRFHCIDGDPHYLHTLERASRDPETVLAIDIETWGNTIKCVGFSWHPLVSVTLPLTGDKAEEYWSLITEVCQGPCAKVLQHGLFDGFWLAQKGIRLQNWLYDTMCMHHALAPNDNHSLDYMASRFTRQPYWKDEAKEADEIVKFARHGFDKLLVYNGIDCCVTRELFAVLRGMLLEAGMLDFYHRHYAEMLAPLLETMLRGCRVDRGEIGRLFRDMRDHALMARDAACRLVGHPLWSSHTKAEQAVTELYLYGATDVVVKQGPEVVRKKHEEMLEKGISDKMLGEVLVRWQAKGRGKTKGGAVKVDNIALRKYQLEAQRRNHMADEIKELVTLTLDHRRCRKLMSMLVEEKIDGDDYFRCTYKFTPWTGRLSSSANPRGTGDNLQNRDRSLRSLFVASPGQLLLEVDLSQAESRVVGGLTGNADMIRLARALPHEYDVHTANAQLIYSQLWQRPVGAEDITKEMRYLGKRAVHAASYGMKGNKLSELLLKEGYTFTPKECDGLILAYMDSRPQIPQWQHETREVLMREHRLFTSWGRSVDFRYQRMDDELFRKAYAYVPQSEIGDLTNQWMFKALWQWLTLGELESRICLQVHDAIVVDAVPEEIARIMQFLNHSASQPRLYGAHLGRTVELAIPCEFKLGRSWKGEVEWKYLPEKAEIERTVERLLTAT